MGWEVSRSLRATATLPIPLSVSLSMYRSRAPSAVASALSRAHKVLPTFHKLFPGPVGCHDANAIYSARMWLCHTLSVLFGGATTWGVLCWLVAVQRRLNLIYEDRVYDVALALKEASIPWDYAGPFRRYGRLCRCFGVARAVHMLAQTPVSDRLAKWNGVERRTRRGSCSSRRPGELNCESRRISDSPDFYLRIAHGLGGS